MLRNGSEKVSWLTFAGCCDAQCTSREGKPHKSAVRFLRSRAFTRLWTAERD